MSTLEVLNAIGEAHAALIRLPELEATIKTLTDERDFIRLERDEAEKTVERLKAQIMELQLSVEGRDTTIVDQRHVIEDLTIRNNMLSESLIDMTSQADDARLVAEERLNRIGEQAHEIATLKAELTASRTLAESFQNVLKGIGASIVAAVEVPEVTSAKPFPVSNPVGLPDSAGPMVDSGDHNVTLEPLVSPKDPELTDTAAGCFPYRYW